MFGKYEPSAHNVDHEMSDELTTDSDHDESSSETDSWNSGGEENAREGDQLSRQHL